MYITNITFRMLSNAGVKCVTLVCKSMCQFRYGTLLSSNSYYDDMTQHFMLFIWILSITLV